MQTHVNMLNSPSDPVTRIGGKDHPRTKESLGVLVKVFDAADKTDETVSILKSMGLGEDGPALNR